MRFFHFLLVLVSYRPSMAMLRAENILTVSAASHCNGGSIILIRDIFGTGWSQAEAMSRLLQGLVARRHQRL